MTNISKLSIGDRINDEPFLVSEAITKSARNGGLMMNLTLRNSTGRIPAVIFGCPLKLTGGEVVRVSGTVGHFNGLQMTVDDIALVPAGDAEALMMELAPRRMPEDTIRETVHALIDSIGDEVLRQFVHEVICFNGRFWTSPGAKRLHHSWCGGLAEHSYAVASIVSMSAMFYPGVNTDIAVAGALLHDIGKIRELSFSGGFQFTDEGRMLSHIYLGAEMISDHVREYRTPIDNQTLGDIVHIILSHHRQREFGAVVQPATLEAELVALADLMDSSMVNLSELVKNDCNAGIWTAFDSKLGRSMRKSVLTHESPTTEAVMEQSDGNGSEPF